MAVVLFSTLIPEREQIDFGEGADGRPLGTYAMLSRYEMSPEQVAELQNLRREMQMAQTQMGKAKTDKETLEATKKVNGKLSEITKLIMVGIPEEVVSKLGMGEKTLLIQYWGQKNAPQAEGQGVTPNLNGQTSPS